MERVPRSIAERHVLIDTSAFLASLDRRDEHHEQAAHVLDRLASSAYRLYTTNYIVVEAHAAILSTLGPEVSRAFLVGGLNLITEIKATSDDERRGREIIFNFRDKRYSLCDAIGFAVMERFGFRLAFVLMTISGSVVSPPRLTARSGLESPSAPDQGLHTTQTAKTSTR